MSREHPLKLLLKVHSCLVNNDLNSEENEFLQLVEEGDFFKIQNLLQKQRDSINVDCCDCKGHRALDIAVTRNDEGLVRQLLSVCTFSRDHLQRALLRAVEENNVELMEILLERWEDNFELKDEECKTQCQLELTPIMLAAINENFEMIRFLVHRGYYVEKPHLPSCRCSQCLQETSSETLKSSLARISAYRAMASPLYIVLVNKDPILSAFKLSYEASILTKECPEYQDVYQQISDQFSQFAADFLHQCRSTEEVEILLRQKKGLKDIRNHRYNRLCLAVQYKQKKFISHPTCQQVLYSTWVEGLSSWTKLSAQWKVLHVITQCLMTPVVCIVHVLLPQTKIIKPMKVPLNRFIYSVTSYIIFLVLLLVSLFWERRQDIREPSIWPRLAADVWILGYVIEIIIKIWSMGLRRYLCMWWNRYDLTMHILFTISESISLSVYLHSYFSSDVIKWNRMELNWYHPILIGEGFFACALVLAFCRILFWYQSQSKLGPLGTSLTYMMNDVIRFFMIFFVLLFSFGIGITSLYRNYKGGVQINADGTMKQQPDAFVSVRQTLKTLFWSTFGMADPDYADIVINENATNSSSNDHVFTEGVGYLLWGSYHLVSVIVMLNMLIAMMAESFERVQGNADMEWKFSRCMIWMSYFDADSTVPSPFNLIPSIRQLALLTKWIVTRVSRKSATHTFALSAEKCCSYQDREPSDAKSYEENYEKLLTQLRRRYLEWKKQQDTSVLPSRFSEKIRQEVLHEVRRHSKVS